MYHQHSTLCIDEFASLAAGKNAANDDTEQHSIDLDDAMDKIIFDDGLAAEEYIQQLKNLVKP